MKSVFKKKVSKLPLIICSRVTGPVCAVCTKKRINFFYSNRNKHKTVWVK